MKTPYFFKTSVLVSFILLATVILPLCFISTQVSGSQYPKLSLLPKDGDENKDDKTLSPYFFVLNTDCDADQLPLKETSANVMITGVIADVTVKQVYINNGKKPLEAIYIFPASTRAAVYSINMKIGDRVIIAKIREKQKAREEYEKAKSKGQSASLLEQQRPNVFQMNVANIMPGDTIQVEMNYTELLVPESGVYEFVYPTVVGPRYSNKPDATASADDKWVSNPYTHAGEAPSYKFNINVSLAAGMPIKEIRCISHDMDVNYDSPSDVKLTLKNTQKYSGNKDVIVQYKLADNKIESGILLYKGAGEEENFFVAMIQPPVKPTDDQIPPREYIFIMDVSGSMGGYPVETSKKLLKNLVENLRQTDKFNVVLFAGGSSRFSEKSVFAVKENIDAAINMIDNQQGGGGTELLPALKNSLSIEKEKGFSRTFVIATDGYVDIEKESFELIKDNLGKANFFAFGIGTSVNRYLIEGIAHAGMGEPFIVTNENECAEKAEKFRKYIQFPVLTDISVNYGGLNSYDVEPKNIPDVLAERPVIIYGKWKGNPQGVFTLTGRSGDKEYKYIVDLSSVKPSSNYKALKYLWAREKIKMLDDYSDNGSNTDIVKKVTDLGIKYNLLTNYTSFIAIDSNIRNQSGKQVTVKQPLPLPENVEDLAVGGNSQKVMCAKSSPGRLKNSSSIQYNSPVILEDVQEEPTPVFLVVEQLPAFIGGEIAYKEFFSKNITYPELAKLNMIEGTVYVQFVVDEKGNVSDIKVIRGIGYGCDEEAIRVCKLTSGKWNPGKSNGKSVKVTFNLPIKFSLNK